MDKTLIFTSDKNGYFFPYIQSENITIENIWSEKYKDKNSLFIRICRKLRVSTGIFFGAWKKEIKQYKKIIIFDGCYDKLLVYYLNRRIPKSLKYIFCWNGKHRLGHVLNAEYPIYSYSPRDCKELGLQYQSTVYHRCFEMQICDKEYDVLFLGRAKSRLDRIEWFYQVCQKANLRTKFLVIGEDHSEVLDVKKETVSYWEYLKILERSKAILDISSDEQDGLSLRPMEALFFSKKLITDNESIIDYDFYHAENIFVLGRDNIDFLRDFILKDVVVISRDIVEQYNIDSWVKRFK